MIVTSIYYTKDIALLSPDCVITRKYQIKSTNNIWFLYLWVSMQVDLEIEYKADMMIKHRDHIMTVA